MTEAQPDAHVTKAARLATSAAANLGIGLIVVYSAGFLVSNAYYGNLWLVDPSILQTRYAAAGVVWLVYAATSLLPCHYLLYFLRHRAPIQGNDADSDWLASGLDAARAWIGARFLPLRLVSWALLIAATVTVIVFGLALFLSPFLPLVMLFALGASPMDVWRPVLSFHVLLLALTALFRSLAMDTWASWEMGKNPHRIALLGVAIVLHAVLFGRTLYPAIPAGSGGGRPLIARLHIEPTPALPQWMAASDVIDSARIVSLSSDFLVALVRLPATDSSSLQPEYCPIAIRSADIGSIEVHSVERPHASVTSRGQWPWAHPSAAPGPCP